MIHKCIIVLLWSVFPFAFSSVETEISIEWSKVTLSNASKSAYWSDPNHSENYGVLKDSADVHLFQTALPTFIKEKKTDRDHDFETSIAVSKYFWGKTNGIVLELGAVNGAYLSQSFPLEKVLGWHRILIDGNPEYWPVLSSNVDAYAFGTAICETAQMVHYVFDGAMSGIVEFMTPKFRSHWDNAFEKPKSEWLAYHKDHIHVKQIHCLPLQQILDHINVTHINFFVLDVEGAELDVLKSINFDKVMFDVVVIETFQDSDMRPVGYVSNVTAFMSDRGYKFMEVFGRNSWFMHKSYVPSRKPDTIIMKSEESERTSSKVIKPSRTVAVKEKAVAVQASKRVRAERTQQRSIQARTAVANQDAVSLLTKPAEPLPAAYTSAQHTLTAGPRVVNQPALAPRSAHISAGVSDVNARTRLNPHQSLSHSAETNARVSKVSTRAQINAHLRSSANGPSYQGTTTHQSPPENLHSMTSRTKIAPRKAGRSQQIDRPPMTMHHV